jgi:uncharacterized repeat protein (TIGR01451 family)
MKRFGVLAAIGFAAVFVSGAWGGTAKIDLSTRAGVVQYLTAHGIDAHGVVIQRGNRNYVGARCPGARWNCTQASRVVQIATGANAVNRAAITADGQVATNCAGGSITQVSTTGDNVVMVGITSASPQSCSITQQNESGKNSAQLDELLQQASGPSQTAKQEAFVTQYNLTGANSFQLKQSVTQSISENVNPVAESQTSTQNFAAYQYNDTGTNSSQVVQSLSQAESDTRATSGTQYQKATLNGHVDQYSNGLSTSQNKQSESQTQTAKPNSGVTQTQVGPAWCCSVQQSNPSDIFRIDQTATQSSGRGANQTEQIVGRCSTTGLCKISQSYTVNGATTTNSCQSQNCTSGISNNGEGVQTCSGECSSSPDELPGAAPPPPGYCTDFVQCPPELSITKVADAPSVTAGSNIGFTITLTNSGDSDATDVAISDALPAGYGVSWSIDSDSTDSCTIAGEAPSQALSCGPETLAGGSSIVLHVTSTTDPYGSCGTYNNTATYTSTNAGTGEDSDSETVTDCVVIG